MKKRCLFLIVALMSTVVAKAQDTLHISDMRLMTNYHVEHWLDSFDFDEYYKVNTVCFVLKGESSPPIKQVAYKMHTDDTITVYGLAGGFSSEYRIRRQYYIDHPQYMGDTSCENSYIFMRLYEAGNGGLDFIGEEQMVHLNETPVSYYIDLGVMEVPAPWRRVPPIPMYEKYFSTPVTVTDSFYMGLRYRDNIKEAGVFLLSVSNIHAPDLYKAMCTRYTVNPWTGEHAEGWRYYCQQDPYPFLFPIIAPPDTGGSADTTFVQDSTQTPDTLGIGVPDLVYRYTAVQPNPATGRVRVTSSFGLGVIEAYDEKGRLAYSTTASGMATTIDVSAWRKGLYLLRIATGAGPTTKKLLVE